MDLTEVWEKAAEVEMAGIGIKDHEMPTTGRCWVMNRLHLDGPKCFSSLVLNPTIGRLNPSAVEASLGEGVDIIYFPTYGARHHISNLGVGGFAKALPVACETYTGISIWEKEGMTLKPEVIRILKMIAQHHVVLATGHLSTEESIALIKEAKVRGVNRIVVNRVSESVFSMPLEIQKEAATLGAMLEHSFLAVTDAIPDPVSMETIRDQINAVGVDHIILSSDFGKAGLASPIEDFKNNLSDLIKTGVSQVDIRKMICDNPKRLLT